MPSSRDLPTRGIEPESPAIPDCKWILYCLGHLGSPHGSLQVSNSVLLFGIGIAKKTTQFGSVIILHQISETKN